MNKRKLNISTKISIAFTIIIVFFAMIFYFLLPTLLNYPPNTINTQFDKEVSKLYYIFQYLIAITGIVILFIIYYKISLRKIDKWIKNKKKEDIPEIRRICFTYPYKMFLTIEILPVIIVLMTLAFTGSHPIVLLFKIGILVFSFTTLVSSIFLLISKNIFYPILKETSGYTKKEKLTQRDSLQRRLIYQIFPGILVTILLMTLIGYSRLVSEKGELLSVYYLAELENLNIKKGENVIEQSKNQIGNKLLSVNDYIFVEYPDGKIETSGANKPSDFFIKYMHTLSESHNNRAYEAYAIDEQGIIQKKIIDNQEYTIGIHYEVVSSSLLAALLFSATMLFAFNLIIIGYITKSIDMDLKKVTDGMKNILKEKDIMESKSLPLTSNDIMGELVQSFNDIQEMTKINIQQIHDNQDILMERERLASLGQLIGGIAHNLKTPIMSVAGATEGLEELIKEYDESIDDPLVNSQDHHEIAKDMESWIPKIRAHIEYMSDIITTVKGQAVALSNDKEITFTIAELVKRVNILMKHELKNAYIYMNAIINVDENLELRGDVNALVQVVNNMISNAIQAYNGERDKNIELKISKDKENVIISVTDYAGGLPEEVQEKLFKEMITTKGKNGTGLGLYMSYSNIKARFGGYITYKTEKGKGTTFDIIIPETK